MTDDWRSWIYDPPSPRGEWTVIEWKREGSDEEHVSRIDALFHPANNVWNVAGVWWRPVS